MKAIATTLAAMLAVVLATVTVAATTSIIESDAIISDKFSNMGKAKLEEVARATAGLIRVQGWRCDSISHLSEMVFSRGYNVACNRSRYSYDIVDRGGIPTVTIDD